MELYRRYRYNLFLVGHNSPISTIVPRILPLTFIHNRWQLTNSYPEVSAKQVRASQATSDLSRSHPPCSSAFMRPALPARTFQVSSSVALKLRV